MRSNELLLSLPASAASAFADIAPGRTDNVFATSDPPGTQLGSGGGTAHLLMEAWRHREPGPEAPVTFNDWLRDSRKLLIHGSGQSRRLPAYAAEGKPLTPVPPTRDETGQRPDKVLLDMQRRAYDRFLRHAPDSYRVMVTCGDVMIHFRHWLPVYPDVDVLLVGLTVSPEEAQAHGVLICPASQPGVLNYFLQKPPAEELDRLSASYSFYLDAGVWLLSEKAVNVLMAKCGWSDEAQGFPAGGVGYYDMFAEFGPSLGRDARERHGDAVDDVVHDLSCAVLPLDDGRFYHFGTNRSLLASVAQLQNPAANQRSFGHASLDDRGDPVVQNAVVDVTWQPEHRHIWIENAHIGAGWTLSERHVITGVPDNDWTLALAPGGCLDLAPVLDGGLCLRVYGFDDPFRGPVGDASTIWLDGPAPDWFARRGIDLAAAGIDPGMDIQEAPLFALCEEGELDGRFVQWLLVADPGPDPEGFAARWLAGPRLSARDLLSRTDIARAAATRARRVATRLSAMDAADWRAAGCRLDLAATADLLSHLELPLPKNGLDDQVDLPHVHDHMFRAALSRRTAADAESGYEQRAFSNLRQLIVGGSDIEPVHPRRDVLDDQIVWGRSPVRLDLAGGWTDTPPFCLEYGGSVVNVAVDLNGQPPIQVFARVAETPEIVIRSIDLGLEDRITSYDQLQELGKLGSGFGIARAALALSGLSPEFHAHGGCGSLRQQLEDEFGGGIELSMLAAVPKGSGLGTSSILAATLLGTLGELCGHYWASDDLFSRTMALEQMLTSGGGWQDQAGGIFGGIKLLETEPGLSQRAVVRWLPGHLLGSENSNTRALLYYTGITRVAHDILGEIVRGIFLNSSTQHGIIRDIAANAHLAADVIQRNDWDGLCEVVRRSWRMNQELDRGTSPPGVQAILDVAGDDVAAAKLLGAGGGGYMLILARDAEAGQRIRQKLDANPPNDGARFIDMRVSEKGLQVTRS